LEGGKELVRTATANLPIDIAILFPRSMQEVNTERKPDPGLSKDWSGIPLQAKG